MSLTKYHCNFLQDDRLIDATPIDGVDDAAALIEADKILGESAYSSIELWDGARMVAIVSRHIGGSSPAGQLLALNQTDRSSA